MGGRADFGQALRKLRESAGMTQKDLGAALGYATDSIRHYEGGRRTPPPELGPKVDHHFNLPAPVMTLLCDKAQKDTTTFGELKEHEQRARRIRIWESRHVPGLLQTEAYARAILQDEALLRDRLNRQRILRPGGPSVRVVIDEAVLYRRVGTSSEFRKQLAHLIAPERHWSIQVVPFVTGAHAGFRGSLWILEFDDSMPLAYVEGNRVATIVDQPSVAGEIRDDFDEI